jgi:asparagine synthase (glutamine-hydrolysing)
MCGIFGYSGSENIEEYFFQLMKHRGPDSKGIKKTSKWNLGHLRLSIIDLDSSANQPFEKDGSILVFNGEIYNYLELKEKYFLGYKFNTNSDTEILITLLNKFGLNILNELNGMFAFAYLNKKQELFLVRDRFGVKPIYFTNIVDNFYFSSEIKPLLFLQKNCNLDETIINSYFDDTATDFDERSGYKNINLIKPGHYALVKQSKINEQSRWYFGFDKKRSYENKNLIIQECEDILLDAIKIRCRSDVPIAITLSGGVDSTLIYTLIKEKLKLNIKPFVFKHANNKTDESALAINLAKKYGDEPVIVQQSIFPLEDLKEALWHLELPMWNSSCVAYLSIYRQIAKMGYKVVLEGHGSDEQLGGYPYMIHSSKIEALQNYKFTDYILRKKIELETQHSGLGQKTKTLRLIRSYLADLKNFFFGERANFNLTLNKSFDYKILPIVLRTFDRLSMSCSLESRMPFMDYRFVEFARKLPVEMKVSKIGSKAILRELLKKYGNDDIYLNKSKMGFASDVPAMFNDKDFKNYIFKLVREFNLENFLTIKDKALSLNNKSISWHNHSDLWKVASVSYYSNFKKIILKLN